jgi:multidrug transporter EmrE-like cation transporter
VTALRITSLLTLTLSYILFSLGLILDDYQGTYTYLIYVSWPIGIASVITNIWFAEKYKLKDWTKLVLVICGIMWLLPFLLITYFGIPCLVIFFSVALYNHIVVLRNNQSKTA